MLRSKLALVNLALAFLAYTTAQAQEATPTPEFSSWPISTSAPKPSPFVPTVTPTATPASTATATPTAPAPMLTPVSLRYCSGVPAEHCLYIMFVAR